MFSLFASQTLASGKALIISPVTRRAATWPLVLELIFFLSNNVRMSKATEMFLRDYNSNNCTQRQRLLLYAHGK